MLDVDVKPGKTVVGANELPMFAFGGKARFNAETIPVCQTRGLEIAAEEPPETRSMLRGNNLGYQAGRIRLPASPSGQRFRDRCDDLRFVNDLAIGANRPCVLSLGHRIKIL
jgi:hypothetical protein